VKGHAWRADVPRGLSQSLALPLVAAREFSSQMFDNLASWKSNPFTYTNVLIATIVVIIFCCPTSQAARLHARCS
jgi:hypothetical protein